MKNFLKRTMLFLCLTCGVFYFSGCRAIYKISAPAEYKKVYQLDDEYPQSDLPLLEGASVFDYITEENDIHLKAGSEKSFDETVEYYADYFEQNEIILSSEKDRSNEYIAKGTSGYYEFELAVEEPSGTWEERLYKSVIEITLEKVNIPNKEELLSFIDLVKNDIIYMDGLIASKKELDENTQDDLEHFLEQMAGILDSLDSKAIEVSQRGTPPQDDFAKLKTSESETIALLYDIFSEYYELIDYALLMNDISVQIGNSGYDSSDLYQNLAGLYQTFDTCAAMLEEFEAPSYIEDFHNNTTKIFRDLCNSLEYCVYALEINDNLRLDAGFYSMDMLMRDMEEAVSAFFYDIDSRTLKIENDLEKIEDINYNLSVWLDLAKEDVNGDAESITPLPETLAIGNEMIKIQCDYIYTENIIPANYRSLDYIAFVQLATNKGAASAKVSVEIPGFTQKFEQKVNVTRAETEIKIHPPLLLDAISALNSGKDAQFVITVEDLASGELILQDTKDILIYSRNDMQWIDEYGTSYVENILAWVTPEAPQIDALIRAAADSASYLTGGEFDSIIGYQWFGDYYDYEITYVQAASLMHALAVQKEVKYIAEPFSSTDIYVQRVKTPAQVIESKGGLCAETAVTVASALQAIGMHPMIILSPGHMQVAVETWYGSGEYYLIETTALSDAANELFDYVVIYYSPEDWEYYLAGEDYIAIDCDFAEQFGIKSID